MAPSDHEEFDMIHLLGVVTAIALLLMCALLPFLPGEYDPLAVPLSLFGQVAGIAGLLLVPVGLLWFVATYSAAVAAKQRALRLLTLGVFAVVLILGSFAALMTSLTLGALFFAGSVFILVRLVRRWPRGNSPPVSALLIASYFVLVPAAVVPLQRILLPVAVDFSRTRAIRNSEPLIADIERYRATTGRYPESLLSLHPDYKPALRGIERFHYELNGTSYNVLFEQVSHNIGTQEVVVYNPRGEQQATGHAMDLLQYAPELLNRTRGYYAVHATAHPHWKSFWFD